MKQSHSLTEAGNIVLLQIYGLKPISSQLMKSPAILHPLLGTVHFHTRAPCLASFLELMDSGNHKLMKLGLLGVAVEQWMLEYRAIFCGWRRG